MEKLLLPVILLTFILFLFRGKGIQYAALVLFLILAVIFSTESLQVLGTGISVPTGKLTRLGGTIGYTVDSLAAFFILVVSFTMCMGLLYAPGYFKRESHGVSSTSLSLHYFAYLWLYLSMVSLSMTRDGVTFLISWELMSVSSFVLVLYHGNEKKTIQAGIQYLVQMHIGFLFLLAGFLIVQAKSGISGFDGLAAIVQTTYGQVAFWLLFAGFAVKAGFLPFHSWLPEAHPAAPSHVSGVMSGIMIKMGILGMFRLISCMHSGFLVPGVIILALALISSIYGVLQAIFQHDLKRLLAWHSIENIGIIGIGLGTGLIGLAIPMPVLAFLGFAGALLHVFNHSLFKTLLFFTAGSVTISTGTRNINLLGGVMKKMPYTGSLFLLASMAICGLPPLNGFVSEFLIFSGLYTGLHLHTPLFMVVFLVAITGLALTGGLAAFCFSKAFGISFLGEARSVYPVSHREVSAGMLFPQLLIALVILSIGIFPYFFVRWAGTINHSFLGIIMPSGGEDFNIQLMQKVGILSLILVLTSLLALSIRYLLLKKRTVDSGPTWGCGYTAGSPVMQYTATSFSSEYARLSGPLIKQDREFKPIGGMEIFPVKRSFEVHSHDAIKEKWIDSPVHLLMSLLRRLAILQTGKMQHYVLYALLFLVTVFILSLFNLI